ncbi:hypothetical protein VNO77_11743 [Canavalia gladiata]|uniref:Uncharacterized protein n=1 Tax=Canavalia gladiata TaxID=3824 RepID=A0AAN9QYI3_CANGL
MENDSQESNLESDFSDQSKPSKTEEIKASEIMREEVQKILVHGFPLYEIVKQSRRRTSKSISVSEKEERSITESDQKKWERRGRRACIELRVETQRVLCPNTQIGFNF